jgi:tetratricopeptide (TPR) repeat protein
VCPLRATSAIQAAVEDAVRANRAPLIDFPRLLEDAIPGPAQTHILGDESFLDHVHPTIEGHRLLAWALFDQLVAWKVVAPQESDAAVVQRVSQKALAGIDARAQAKALVQVIQVLIWAGKSREAMRLVEKAEEVCPGLSDVATYRGRILEKTGQIDEAMKCYEEAVRRNPDDSLALSRVAQVALKRGQLKTARACFATAILRTPPSAPLSFRTELRLGLGISFAELRQWKEARLEFQAVLRMAPDRVDAREYLDRVEAELARDELPALPGLDEAGSGKPK